MRLADLFRPSHARPVPPPEPESALVELACRHGDLEARRAAVEGLVSEAALRRVAIEGRHLDARLHAVARIGNPRTLAAIMRERKNHQLMLACFARIADEQVLAEIARDPGFNIATRRIAVQMYSQPTLLAEVLDGLAEPGLREALRERGAAGVASSAAPTPGEIEARVERLLATYAEDVVVEALASFRDSPGAVQAMGVLLRRSQQAPPRLVEVLTRLLRHAGPRIRMLAIDALAPRAGALRDALTAAAEHDPDPRVRDAATRALQAAGF